MEEAIVQIIPSGKTLGATIEGLDLSQPLSESDVDQVVATLGRYGVVRFPKQTLTAAQQRAFSARFGELEINVAGSFQEPGLPEVMILSNIVENGKPIGIGDAGQDWHTDMSYNRMIAFSNVLYGIRIPHRDGKPLGATTFCNMHAAYEALPEDMKQRLDGMTVLHDFDKFWEMMRRERGSTRPPLTPAQRAARPPVSHPLFLEHPITGRKVLYANPGYSMRINELPQEESDQVLDFLFKHQLQERFFYKFEWQEGDVLMWDNMGTIHKAVDDYRADEPRLIKRCQVMATRFFDDGGQPRRRHAMAA
ncbi:MAG: TauD/TfdA family dioxygenase [Burkholderiales bacterium]|nr:TauD/TfdA family dioxygenase [Burkholderiales bacterium]